MKVRLIISPTGEIGFFSVTGSYEEGRVKLPPLAQALGAACLLPDLPLGEVEQHRHGPEEVHQHTEDRVHDH
ncbi:MAG TPA: hypothetical protein VNL71_24300 [Chloroflexota bacterium]|nr:hypothetical protein [Chloroflexota bacterium]